MPHKPILAIIIISYNTKDLTLQTLQSVLADIQRTPPLHQSVELCVVDNNSDDGSVAKIKAFLKENSNYFAHTTVITHTENQGFARANNAGIKHTQASLILLLNSDTIITPHALMHLLNTYRHIQTVAGMRSQRYGVLASSLLYPDHTPQLQGGSLPGIISLATHMVSPDNLPFIPHILPSTQHLALTQNADGVIPAGWVGGTAMLLNREMLEEIGLLDENIFMYGEDIELCMRAHTAGWLVAIAPQSQIVHIQSASSSSQTALIGEFLGYMHIARTHFSMPKRVYTWLILVVGAFIRLILFGIMRPSRVGAYLSILGLLLGFRSVVRISGHQ